MLIARSKNSNRVEFQIKCITVLVFFSVNTRIVNAFAEQFKSVQNEGAVYDFELVSHQHWNRVRKQIVIAAKAEQQVDVIAFSAFLWRTVQKCYVTLWRLHSKFPWGAALFRKRGNKHVPAQFFKYGDNADIKNCRKISILSSSSKILKIYICTKILYLFSNLRVTTSIDSVWSPCLIWYEKWWNETTNMFSCTYISLLGRYNVTCSLCFTDPLSQEPTVWIVALSLSSRPFTGGVAKEFHNKWFVEPWFGVIVGGTEPLQKTLHLTTPDPATAHQDAATFNFKHRMARTK